MATIANSGGGGRVDVLLVEVDELDVLVDDDVVEDEVDVLLDDEVVEVDDVVLVVGSGAVLVEDDDVVELLVVDVVVGPGRELLEVDVTGAELDVVDELDVDVELLVDVVLGGGVGTHVASQPSPSAVLPSSQVSPAGPSMWPSPHSERVALIGLRRLPARMLPFSSLQSSMMRPASLTGFLNPAHGAHVTLIRVPCFFVPRYCLGATDGHVSPSAKLAAPATTASIRGVETPVRIDSPARK